jgi:hypothetical protein
LQIVCHGFWDEKPPARGQLFLEGYQTGEAWKELGRYCGKRLDDLSVEEREAASDEFGYLVARGGAKRAYCITELSDLVGAASGTVIESALGKLADKNSRILRTFRDPAGKSWRPNFRKESNKLNNNSATSSTEKQIESATGSYSTGLSSAVA